jgi:hypothetical protein
MSGAGRMNHGLSGTRVLVTVVIDCQAVKRAAKLEANGKPLTSSNGEARLGSPQAERPI